MPAYYLQDCHYFYRTALRGLNISITTTAKTDDECKALLAGFRFPFKN